MLSVLELNLNTYYYWCRKATKPHKDATLISTIKEVWSKDHHYGVRRIYLALRKLDEFKTINHKKVQCIMHEIGLQGTGYRKQTRKYDSSKGPEGKRVKNRFHRKFKTNRPMQKLISDVTEFKIPKTGERVYLEPIMDLFNNEILTYSISTRPNLEFTQAPL